MERLDDVARRMFTGVSFFRFDWECPVLARLRRAVELHAPFKAVLQDPRLLEPFQFTRDAVIPFPSTRSVLGRSWLPISTPMHALEVIALAQPNAVKGRLTDEYYNLQFDAWGDLVAPRSQRYPQMRSVCKKFGTNLLVFREQLTELLDLLGIPDASRLSAVLVECGDVPYADRSWISRILSMRSKLSRSFEWAYLAAIRIAPALCPVDLALNELLVIVSVNWLVRNGYDRDVKAALAPLN